MLPSFDVGVTGLEPATAWSQTRNATNCATPRCSLKALLKRAFLKCDAKVRTFFESRKTFRNFFLFFVEKSIKYRQKANETGPKLMRLEPVYTYNVYVSEDLELEIVLCVVIADVFNHLTYTLLFVTGEWDETILDILANEVAESATEVFVTWV